LEGETDKDVVTEVFFSVFELLFEEATQERGEDYNHRCEDKKGKNKEP
jgi:hypothetical protein